LQQSNQTSSDGSGNSDDGSNETAALDSAVDANSVQATSRVDFLARLDALRNILDSQQELLNLHNQLDDFKEHFQDKFPH